MAEKSLSEFIRQGWRYIDRKDFITNWHIDAICERLEDVAHGRLRNVIINIPPRHMKSTGACVAFPAWVWAQDDSDKPPESHLGPSTQFLYASYAQSLSVRDSIKCRRLIKSPWYQENWGDRFNFVSDQNAKTRFDTDQLGYRISTSVDGTATGEGGDIIMIDDPHNTREAESETVRNSVLAWWDETMSSRLNDPQTGAYVIIMQRVHERDLCGHILASETGWEHLCLPARFEIDHPHRWPRDPRKTDGEILWPARMPLKELDKIESRMGPYAVAGQMQQRPAPREGGMFQRAWFEGGKDARGQEHPRRIIKEADVPADVVEWRHWDLAATEYKVTDTRGARTAGVRIGRTKDGRYIVRHCMAFAKEGAAVMQAIYARALADGPTVSISMPQDPAQAGKQQKLVYVQKFAGFNIRFEAERGGDKVQRAEPFASQCENGNVWLVEGDWNKEFLDEICLFPGGARKDIADACSGAFGRLVPKLLDEGIPVGPTVYGLSGEPSRPGLSSMNPAYTGGIYGELPFHQ
jgi:predicted phage terminase large subunit-like protein